MFFLLSYTQLSSIPGLENVTAPESSTPTADDTSEHVVPESTTSPAQPTASPAQPTASDSNNTPSVRSFLVYVRHTPLF